MFPCRSMSSHRSVSISQQLLVYKLISKTYKRYKNYSVCSNMRCKIQFPIVILFGFCGISVYIFQELVRQLWNTTTLKQVHSQVYRWNELWTPTCRFKQIFPLCILWLSLKRGLVGNLSFRFIICQVQHAQSCWAATEDLGSLGPSPLRRGIQVPSLMC